MTFILIIGLALLAAAVYMLVRAALGANEASGTTTATLQQIGAYGFSGSDVPSRTRGERRAPEQPRQLSREPASPHPPIDRRRRHPCHARIGRDVQHDARPLPRLAGDQQASASACCSLWLLGISGLSMFWVVVLTLFGVVIGWMLPLGDRPPADPTPS